MWFNYLANYNYLKKKKANLLSMSAVQTNDQIMD